MINSFPFFHHVRKKIEVPDLCQPFSGRCHLGAFPLEAGPSADINAGDFWDFKPFEIRSFLWVDHFDHPDDPDGGETQSWVVSWIALIWHKWGHETTLLKIEFVQGI